MIKRSLCLSLYDLTCIVYACLHSENIYVVKNIERTEEVCIAIM